MAQAQVPVTLGIDVEALQRDLVDQASENPGIDRSDFMIEGEHRPAETPVLDQTYFALDAEGFAAFQGLVDNPPSATAGLLRTLTSQVPWYATAAALGKSTPAQ